MESFTASLLHYYTVDRSRSTHDLKGFYRRREHGQRKARPRVWGEFGGANFHAQSPEEAAN